jgi:beta-glucanase (GH16 family)
MPVEDRRRARNARRGGAHSGSRGSRGSTRMKAALTAATVIVAALVVAVFATRPGTSGTPAAALDGPVTPTAAPVKTSTLQPPKSWKLTFNSNFSGSTLDSSVWATCFPWDSASGCGNFGNDNEDKEWYQPSQVKVHNGVLELTAEHAPTAGTNQAGDYRQYSCRSGMVTSYPGLNFTYGFVQITAQIPYGNGLWPALWLAASDEKWPPEIDILEHWADQANAGVYLHPQTGARQGGRVDLTSNLSAGWHTFTLVWTKTRLTSYIDGQVELTTTTGVPDQPMYLDFNLADTSTSAGTCNGTLKIKSVEVWQPSS